MPVETGTFTVGVFKDVDWARRGLDALRAKGFAAGSLSILVRDSPEAAALVEQILGERPEQVDLVRVGQTLAIGPFVDVLDGPSHDLGRQGIAATARRAGFQAHDGQIFETLTGRGGVLVGVRDEPRAADALTVLHAYGAGNAAIGAWHGRV